MVAYLPGGGDERLLSTALRRADALGALTDGPVSRAALMDHLGVSRTTIHRTVRSLEGEGLVVQEGDEFRLSPLGRVVADEVLTCRARVRTARRLRPLLDALGEDADVIDPGSFTDATITTMGPSNPYAPVTRFMELLLDSETIRGFDTTTVAPVFVDAIREAILGGMEVDVVYLPSVVDTMVETYPDALAAAVDSGHLSLSSHPDLPFGLAIFDERIGVGGYDEETGMLRAFVDTDDPAARGWALRRYRHYRREAEDVVLPERARGELQQRHDANSSSG